MNIQMIRDFFDCRADSWDEGMVRNDRIINTILDNAQVNEGVEVLDVACGTGVLIPYYLERQVAAVTAIDLSEKMCAIARDKFLTEEKVTIICGDVNEFNPGQLYDRIVVYNALPHFPDDCQLISKLAELLRENGRLTIAHGMSRERINNHHRNVSPEIKKPLKPAIQLAEIMTEFLDVQTVIDNEEMYQLTATKPADRR
jgi:demethylmenaquinone methyltransferase/2-methoxy-6-polyprenyl-1,4-benzoquinol methylase